MVFKIMWCDKYGPRTFDQLDFHEDKAFILQQLAKGDDFPHLLVHGPPGSGRRTLVGCLLNEIYGPIVEKVKVENMEFSTPSNKTVEISALASSVHVMLTPSDAGIQDRIVVQEIIKKIAQTNQVNRSCGKSFKVIILDDVDNLSKDAQHGLRRTMEKCSSICRLVLICNTVSKVIEALRSRTLSIRIPAPSSSKIEVLLKRIAKAEQFNIPNGLLKRITDEADGNAQRAILLMETCRVQSYPLTDNQQILKLEWKKPIQDIANMMVEEQTPAKLIQIRDQFYNLLSHLIPPVVIFEDLMDSLLPLCEEKIKLKVVDLASTCQHRCALGQKAIFHLEAFAVGFMCIYKNYIFDNLEGFC